MQNPLWRPGNAKDLDVINRIADQIHPALPESADVFAEKFNLFSEGCFVFTQDLIVIGYGLSHPWKLFDIPALDSFLGKIPDRPECLFIHDVAILPNGRGFGGAEQFVNLCASVAQRHKLPSLALVSVYGTAPLWTRFGFNIVEKPKLVENLRSYGDADYMTRRLE